MDDCASAIDSSHVESGLCNSMVDFSSVTCTECGSFPASAQRLCLIYVDEAGNQVRYLSMLYVEWCSSATLDVLCNTTITACLVALRLVYECGCECERVRACANAFSTAQLDK